MGDIRSRLGNTLHGLPPRGRTATGFTGLARPSEDEVAATASTPSETNPAGLENPERLAGGEDREVPAGEPSSGRGEGAQDTADQALTGSDSGMAEGLPGGPAGPSAEGEGPRANLPVEKRRPANETGSLLQRLVSGILGEEDGQMARKTITLDNQVATYVQDRLLRETREAAEAKNLNRGQSSQRITLAGLLRGALETPLEAETGKKGKRILAKRHQQYGAWRTNLDIPESLMGAIRLEMNRYSTRDHILTEAAVIELRIASWAVTQPDWNPEEVQSQA